MSPFVIKKKKKKKLERKTAASPNELAKPLWIIDLILLITLRLINNV